MRHNTPCVLLSEPCTSPCSVERVNAGQTVVWRGVSWINYLKDSHHGSLSRVK